MHYLLDIRQSDTIFAMVAGNKDLLRSKYSVALIAVVKTEEIT